MTTFSKLFKSGSRLQDNTEIDSHLLRDLGLSRVVAEHAEADQGSDSQQRSAGSYEQLPGGPAKRWSFTSAVV
jgi:hypothetical protein